MTMRESNFFRPFNQNAFLLGRHEIFRISRSVLPKQQSRLIGPQAIVPPQPFGRRIAPERHNRQIVSLSSSVVEYELISARVAWKEFQSNRKRDAVYDYLGAVYATVQRWKKEHRVKAKSHKALIATGRCSQVRNLEPFAAVIFCTSDPHKVDSKTRSKWCRALRYAERFKADSQSVAQFIKSRGGINECAARWSLNDGAHPRVHRP